MIGASIAGCVQRRLTVTTDPPGALVYLNNQEFGRTPVTRDFTWYGTYDVTVRKEGYETLVTTGKVIAPWWQWIPFDLFAELFPVTDHKSLNFTLKPDPAEPPSVAEMLGRAQQMRDQLQSSGFTRQPTTQPG